MICKWWKNGSAIKISCITKYLYRFLNKVIIQLINQKTANLNRMKFSIFTVWFTVVKLKLQYNDKTKNYTKITIGFLISLTYNSLSQWTLTLILDVYN